MSDLKLTWDLESGSADFEISDVDSNDLAIDDGLETAIILSLFCDRRAEDGDVLPEGETDRRGWWADVFPVVAGDKFGSRLWLIARSKETPDVLARGEEYAREALQWLIDDKVSDQIDLEVTRPRRGQWSIAGTIHRPQIDSIHFKFNRTWAAQAQRL